jgi:hypothetical protein
MNMAESMYTLLNMAKLQMLSEETVGGLRTDLTQMNQARYNSDGMCKRLKITSRFNLRSCCDDSR